MAKFPTKLLLYSSIIYILIFATALSYNSFIVQPTKALLSSSTGAQHQVLSIGIISTGTQQAQSSTSNQSSIEIILLELTVMSILVLLEIKYKLISKLLKSNITKILFFLIIFSATLYILTSIFGLPIGIILWIAFVVLVIFTGIIFDKFLSRNTAASVFIIFSFLICWSLLNPIANLLTNNITEIITLDAVSLTVLLICTGLIIYRLNNRISIKNTINIASFIICLCGAIYLGLFLNIWYAVILLICLAVYDYIAVFKIKTMGFIANRAVKNLVPAMFLFGNEKDINKKLDSFETGKKPKPKKKGKRLDASAIGNGDIVIPAAIFCSAIFYLPNLAPYILIGAIVGMAMNSILLWYREEKMPKASGIPALPLLLAGILISIGIGLLV